MSVCGRLKQNIKSFHSAATQSGSSMHFWGICCESGKHYNQVVGQRFRVTMAVLEPISFQNDASERIVSLIVLRDGIEYLLCVLKHGEIHQVSLNLVFDKGENVRFYIKGHGNVYLSGYQLTGSEEDVVNDENGYLCPLVEVKTKNKKKKDSISRELQNDGSEMGLEKGKRKSKADKASLAGTSGTSIWSTILSQSQDDEDDESDEDFTLSDEESESDEEDTSDEEDVDDELDENELDDDSDKEEEETEMIMNSHGSQKRRKKEKVLPQKRSKKDSFNNSSNAAAAGDVICIDDDDDDSESESDSDDKDKGMKSSFDSTPKSKKQANAEVVSNEKKKKKKKKQAKKLNDISAVSEASMNSQFQKLNSPVDESTPNKSVPKQVQKLKGGLIVQDLVVGRGPTATEGKIVSVFYIGRLPDKNIFDSRVAGAGKKPFSFKLGAREVIKGWDLGLVGMRVGGKRRLRVPPKMGYGNQQTPVIPPDTTLNFVVELVAVS